jgi:hypothetical protein
MTMMTAIADRWLLGVTSLAVTPPSPFEPFPQRRSYRRVVASSSGENCSNDAPCDSIESGALSFFGTRVTERLTADLYSWGRTAQISRPTVGKSEMPVRHEGRRVHASPEELNLSRQSAGLPSRVSIPPAQVRV